MHPFETLSRQFVGLLPSITVETYYEKGELDINVIPLAYQITLTKRFDFRLTPIANYGIRNTQNGFSHIGLGMSTPIFLIKRADKGDIRSGFFLAPVAGITRNIQDEHTNLTFAVEPGYHSLFENKWAFSFGVQFGATHFTYDTGERKWENHFGVKVIFGKWF